MDGIMTDQVSAKERGLPTVGVSKCSLVGGSKDIN